MPDASGEETADVELVLQHLKQARAFDFTGYKRATLARRIDKRMEQLGISGVRRIRGSARGRPRRVRAALQHDPHQRHVLLPRRRDLGRHPRQVIPDLSARRRRRADTGVEHRLLERAEGHSAVMLFAEQIGRRRSQGAPQGLRDRHRRGGPGPGPGRPPTPTGRWSRCPRSWPSGTSAAPATSSVLHPELRRAVIFGRHDVLLGRADPPLDCCCAATRSCTSTPTLQRRAVQSPPLLVEARRLPRCWARWRCCSVGASSSSRWTVHASCSARSSHWP